MPRPVHGNCLDRSGAARGDGPLFDLLGSDATGGGLLSCLLESDAAGGGGPLFFLLGSSTAGGDGPLSCLLGSGAAGGGGLLSCLLGSGAFLITSSAFIIKRT